jgi:hypothetical protein
VKALIVSAPVDALIVFVFKYIDSNPEEAEALDNDVKPVTDNVPESTMLVPM